MKSITRDTIEAASTESLINMQIRYAELIANGNIEWKNASGVLRKCPWEAFNATGAVVHTRDSDPILWDLGIAVQIRCEAERRNAGNMIAAYKATLQVKTNTLTASVRTKGMSRVKCPVTDQLSEAESVLGNYAKVTAEINQRTEQQRCEAQQRAEDGAMASIAAEEKAVAEQIKAAAKEKAEAAVKAAFNAKSKDKEKEGNGQPAPVPAGV